jgi:hypothetical protein
LLLLAAALLLQLQLRHRLSALLLLLSPRSSERG